MFAYVRHGLILIQTVPNLSILFPFLGQYQNLWPVKELARQYLGNHQQYERKKNTTKDGQAQDDEDENTATAGANNDGNGDATGDMGESDVSEIDDDD